MKKNSELPRTVLICIPPQLEAEVIAKSQEQPPLHPAWSKWRRRGRHFVIATNSLDDITELADFARVELEEPDEPLSKLRRQACQALLQRTNRYAKLEPLGSCHCLATQWRERPLKAKGSSLSGVVRELRRLG